MTQTTHSQTCAPEQAEEWRAVVGYEGRYEVSDHGRVRSLDRLVRISPSQQSRCGHLTALAGRTLRPGRSSNGYLTVNIDGESRLVQHLVAKAFIGSRPSDALVLHGDGDRTNNRLKNLRYGTYADNHADMVAHGTRVRGSAYGSAKLHEWTASVVRALRGVWPQSQLAMLFDVSPAAIQAVHDGRTWLHAPDISREVALAWFWSFGPAGAETVTPDLVWNARRELERRDAA